MNIKRFFTIILFSISIFSFAAGAKETYSGEHFSARVIMPTGAPAIALSKMISETTQITPDSKTEYEILQSPELLQARLLSGEADIAVVPSNLAAVLHSKKNNVTLLGSLVWGVLYGVTTENIKGIKDLKGKTILTFGRGLTPDITIREIIKASGLTADVDVMFNYVSSAAEVMPAFITGKATIVIIPEPMVSMLLSKKSDAKVFLDVQSEWKKKVDKNSYPQASVIVTTQFLNDHPEYVEKFVAELDSSVKVAVKKTKETAEIVSKIPPNLPAPVLVNALPRMNIKWVEAKKAKPALEKYFSILMETDPKYVGGKMPNESFYYTGKK